MMQWLTAWLLLFMLLYVLSRNRPGHTVIYYTAWLAVVFLIVTHYDMIDAIFQKGFTTS